MSERQGTERRPEPGEAPPQWADAVYDAVKKRLAAAGDEQES